MNIYKMAFAFAAACLFTAVLFFINGNGEYADPLLIAFLFCLQLPAAVMKHSKALLIPLQFLRRLPRLCLTRNILLRGTGCYCQRL